MSEPDDRISLKIDLANGTIELDAPAANFDQAIEKTQQLATILELPRRRVSPIAAGAPPPDPPSVEAVGGVAAPSGIQRRVKRGAGGSASRPGRIGSFEEVRGLLSEAQEMALRNFYQEKQPAEQVDQVLVAMCKGEELLERRGFTYNEIYTLLRLAGERSLPRALDVVLSRMLSEQYVTREGPGFATKFVGRDRVEQGFGNAGA